MSDDELTELKNKAVGWPVEAQHAIYDLVYEVRLARAKAARLQRLFGLIEEQQRAKTSMRELTKKLEAAIASAKAPPP